MPHGTPDEWLFEDWTLLAIPLYLIFALVRRSGNGINERPLSVLRECYAPGELSDDEFERRREQLERAG